VLLVFCAAGPLIGLVVFAAGTAVATVVGGQRDGVWLAPFFLIYGLPFAHFIGIASAALAAMTSAGLWRITGRTPAWIGLAAGLVSFSLAAVSGHIQMPARPESPAGPEFDSFGLAFSALMALVHVVSSWACWLLSRGLLHR
jgi:hypothetical protein